MSLFQIGLALLTVVILAVGQILFKMAASQLSGTGAVWLAALRSWPLWAGLLLYGIATVLWLLLLRHVPLRLAYPFVGLAFVFVPLMAHWCLGETLHPYTLWGALLISVGVVVSTLGG